MVAVTVTLAGLGRSGGAAYSPEDEIVPRALLPPAVPLTLQVTAVLEDPVTAAVNCCGLPRSTFAEEGDTLTATTTGGGWEELIPPQLGMRITDMLKHNANAKDCN